MPLTALESVDALGVAVLVLHIAFAAIWFGHKLGLPPDARATARVMDGPQPGLLGRLRRWARVDGVAAAGTLLTGVALAYRRGWDEVPWTVYVGAGVAVALIVVSVMLTRPARRSLRAALGDGLRPEATAAARRLATAVNVEGFLWLAALVLMVI